MSTAAPGEQAEEDRRCPSEDWRWFALAQLTPAEFEQRVAQVGCGKVPWEAGVLCDDPLGFRSTGSRLEEHFGWIARRCPKEAWTLLTREKAHLTPGLVEQVLSPEQLRRFRFRGNPEWVLGELIATWEHRSPLTPELARVVARAVAREVTGETDRGPWLVRRLARPSPNVSRVRSAWPDHVRAPRMASPSSLRARIPSMARALPPRRTGARS